MLATLKLTVFSCHEQAHELKPPRAIVWFMWAVAPIPAERGDSRFNGTTLAIWSSGTIRAQCIGRWEADLRTGIEDTK